MNSQYSNIDLSTIWQQKINNTPYLNGELSREFIDQFDSIVDSVLTEAIQNQNKASDEYFREIEAKAKVLYDLELTNTK